MLLQHAYFAMIDRTQDKCYFMWDAVKNALIMEFQDGNHDFILDLCKLLKSSDKQALLIDALTEYGKVSADGINKIFTNLSNNSAKWEEVAYVLLEVSYNFERYEYLEKLAYHKNDFIRQSVARFLYYLWMQKPNEALRILDEWALGVRKSPIPNIYILSTCFYASSLILADDGTNQVLVQRLRKTWVIILDKIMYRDLDHVAVIGKIINVLRSAMVDITAIVGWFVLAPIWEVTPLYSIDHKDLDEFFKREKSEKEYICQLINFLDYEFNDLVNYENVFKYVIDNEDFVATFIMTTVLSIHIRQYDFPVISPSNNPVIEFTKRLLDYSITKENNNLSTIFLFGVIVDAGKSYRSEGVDKRFLEMYEDSLNAYYFKRNCMGRNSRGHSTGNTGFSFYHQIYYLYDPGMNSQFTEKIIRHAVENKNYIFLKKYILETSDVSTERKPWPFLRALRPLIKQVSELDDEEFKIKIEKDLIYSLGKIRIFAREETDQFFNTLDMNDNSINKIHQIVQATGKNEYMGTIFVGRLVWLYLDLLTSREENMFKQVFVWWIKQAASTKHIAIWFSTFVKLLINLMYIPDGEYIFKSPNIKKILD